MGRRLTRAILTGLDYTSSLLSSDNASKKPMYPVPLVCLLNAPNSLLPVSSANNMTYILSRGPEVCSHISTEPREDEPDLFSLSLSNHSPLASMGSHYYQNMTCVYLMVSLKFSFLNIFFFRKSTLINVMFGTVFYFSPNISDTWQSIL